MFVLGISEGCGLIKDDDRGILEQGSCQGDTLLFNGKNFIAGEATDDALVVITLVKE